MLVYALQEADSEGVDPHADPAVAILTARIGFCSPVNSMSREAWEQIVRLCAMNTTATIALKKESVQ